jgi:hypothetical protein
MNGWRIEKILFETFHHVNHQRRKMMQATSQQRQRDTEDVALCRQAIMLHEFTMRILH